MSRPLMVRFAAGSHGKWRIESSRAVKGDGLAQADRLEMTEDDSPGLTAGSYVWVLRGTTSNTRYSSRAEVEALAARQEPPGRPQALCAALIPITKSEEWWALAQDERRSLLEDRSRHIAIGMEYLPQVARRLHHCRDIGEPFDFVTWFEYAPEDGGLFEELVDRLRRTEEWRYVEREVDVRLRREPL